MATSITSTTLTFNDATTRTTADSGYAAWTKPSRSIGPTYTNSTGRQIVWHGTISQSATGGTVCNVNVNGVTVTRVAAISSPGPYQNNNAGFMVIVPNGHTYSLTSGGGSPTCRVWSELP